MVRFPSFSPNQRFLFGLPIGRAFSGWIDTVPTTQCASWGIERWEDTKLVRRTSEFNLRNGIFSVIVALDHNSSAALVLHFSHNLRWNNVHLTRSNVGQTCYDLFRAVPTIGHLAIFLSLARKHRTLSWPRFNLEGKNPWIQRWFSQERKMELTRQTVVPCGRAPRGWESPSTGRIGLTGMAVCVRIRSPSFTLERSLQVIVLNCDVHTWSVATCQRRWVP